MIRVDRTQKKIKQNYLTMSMRMKQILKYKPIITQNNNNNNEKEAILIIYKREKNYFMFLPF